MNINDVAEAAGVSRGSVSNYLNNKKVSDKIKLKIEAAIKELNYIPNSSAILWSSGRSFSFNSRMLYFCILHFNNINHFTVYLHTFFYNRTQEYSLKSLMNILFKPILSPDLKYQEHICGVNAGANIRLIFG